MKRSIQTKPSFTRRNFIKTSALAGMGMGLAGTVVAGAGANLAGSAGTDTSLTKSAPALQKGLFPPGKRVGIIGLDTSHSIEFTKVLNGDHSSAVYVGYKVVAAFPEGSLDIESSVRRIPEYTAQIEDMGIEIVESIDELLLKTDLILLETNDGRRHLEQAIPVMKAGKTLFIDKPLAASLADGIAIFEAAKHYKVPVFSSSSLRYMPSVREVVSGRIGKVLGADAYSPCVIEKTHPDFFWYGIHGVETLYTVMGTGCTAVTRVHTEGTDLATGVWEDGRIGTFRGTRTGKHLYGGTAFGDKGNAVLGPYGGYEPLLTEIVKFFQTGHPPVPPEETLEILAFMEAADESKRRKGASVQLAAIRERAQKAAQKKLKELI